MVDTLNTCTLNGNKMQSLVHKNLGNQFRYNLSYLRSDGFYISGASIEIVLENGKSFTPSVGGPRGKMINEEVRKCTAHSVVLKVLGDEISESLRDLSPSYLHRAIPFLNREYDGKLLVYRPGDFFKPHRDTKISREHFATGLLFPPSTFTGGTLEVTKHDGEIFRFEGSETDWNLVLFHPTLLHSCQEVLTGKRLVIKFDVRYDETIYKYCRETVSEFIPRNMVTERETILGRARESLSSLLKGVEDRVFENPSEGVTFLYKVQDIIKRCNSQLSPDQHHCVLDRIEDEIFHGSKLIFVVLQTFYHDAISANLFPNDYSLLARIWEKFPRCYLQNICGKIFRGDFDDCDLSIPDEMSSSPRKAVISLSSIRSSGELVSTSQEYNDEDYDEVSHRNYTCIVILP